MSHNPSFYSRNLVENVIKNFDLLTSATSVEDVLEYNRQISILLGYQDEQHGLSNFLKLKNLLNVKSLNKWNRVSSILKTLDQKASQKEYSVRSKVQGKRVLVIGGGLSGLRVSIELLLLGANVFCIEKRNEFSRNNVIHLWPNVINDMYTFEAKRLYGQFCVGSIDHISIRQLQLILLKIAIIYGIKFFPSVTFEEICPRIINPNENQCAPDFCQCCCHKHGFGGGVIGHFSSSNQKYHHIIENLNKQFFDIIIGCDGRRNTFSRYFPRNNRRGKLAIGLTANFINSRTEEEAHCPEISGISKIYNQKWFKDLQNETGIELENLVYYRDETHYFVMTATKASLLRRGVLKLDYGDSHQLLHLNNIDTQKLMKYSKDAAEWSSKLDKLDFARNSNNMPDVALFDFTSMYSATNASCAKKIYLNCCNSVASNQDYKYTLMLLCGDSLLEPFWPTGSGAGRGFLSALDAAWTVGQWCVEVEDEKHSIDSMLNVISKREYIYRLLAQTSPENTTSKGFTIDPQTRYKNLNLRHSKAFQDIKAQVFNLIIDKVDLDVKNYLTSYESKRARRATVGIDPGDVLKAKNLDFDKPLPPYSRPNIHNVPYNLTRNSFTDCDNIKVIELKPKNFDNQSHPQTSNSNEVKPRNDDSNKSIKNYCAKNHFFGKYEIDDEVDRNYSNKVNNENNMTFKKNFMKQDFFINNSESEDKYDISKENYQVPNFKELFNLDYYSDKDDQDNEKLIQSCSVKNKANYLKDKFYYETHNNDTQTFQYSSRNKAKKSYNILDRAQSLEQKFDEIKKPFTPKLSKVGKIHENDWNVEMWNSDKVFAPKTKERKNLVHDNSKDLLQSRIQQLNNNIAFKEEIQKSVSTNKISTNEYVNMLTNEVCQKFEAPITAQKSQLIESFHADSSQKSEDISKSTVDLTYNSSTLQKNNSEILKPLGECRRCNQAITAIDRVSVLGQNYHRHCLTCKICFIRLTRDEIDNDEFICKICSKIRKVPDKPSQSFFLNPLMVEAKKNFLVNVEQVDLRERAEFELFENKKPFSTMIEELQNNETIENIEQNEFNLVAPEVSSDFNENNDYHHDNQNEESSEVSESDVVSFSASDKDNNYTDDERSDDYFEERFKNSKVISHPDNTIYNNIEDEKIMFTSLPNANYFEESKIFLETTDEKNDDLLFNIEAKLNLDSSNLDNHFLLKNDGFTSNDDPKSFALENASIITDNKPSIIDECNNTEDLIGSKKINELKEKMIDNVPLISINRTLENITTSPSKFSRFSSTFSMDPESAVADDDKPIGKKLMSLNKNTLNPLHRYSGKFTEKLYRTLSQPTLAEQINSIDRKLKKCSSTLKQISQDDLPFADSQEDLSLPSHVEFGEVSQTIINNLPSLAPVASIDDI